MAGSAVLEVLANARELYAEAPSHAGIGQEVDPEGHCLLTAVSAAMQALGRWGVERVAVNALRRAAGIPDDTVGLIAWNASHSTGEGLALFDRAIEAES